MKAVTFSHTLRPGDTKEITITSAHSLLWFWVNDNYADSEMLLSIIGEGVDEETLEKIMLEINPELHGAD